MDYYLDVENKWNKNKRGSKIGFCIEMWIVFFDKNFKMIYRKLVRVGFRVLVEGLRLFGRGKIKREKSYLS